MSESQQVDVVFRTSGKSPFFESQWPKTILAGTKIGDQIVSSTGEARLVTKIVATTSPEISIRRFGSSYCLITKSGCEITLSDPVQADPKQLDGVDAE